MSAGDPLSVVLLGHLASAKAPTGAERSLALLAGGLSRRGHRVRVVVPGEWALRPELEREGIDVHRIPTRCAWLTYHEARPWPVAAGKWLRWALPQAGSLRLARALRRWRPDVVHVNCLPHVRGARAASRIGLPVVWHLREILPPGARRRWFAKLLDRYAGRIVAVSQAVAAWVREEGITRPLQVIYNGVETRSTDLSRATARQELGIPGEGIVVGLYGQILPHKGALDFVAAGRRALISCPELRFVIAGSGPEEYLRRVDQAIASTPAPQRFHRLAARPDAETLLAASDLVALTTRTPDPLPRAVLEAMAAGRPVVAYRSGGVPEMVDDGETGRIVDVGDVPALAVAMADLGRNTSRREAMGRTARLRALERFTIERHVASMETVLVDASRDRSAADGVV